MSEAGKKRKNAFDMMMTTSKGLMRRPGSSTSAKVTNGRQQQQQYVPCPACGKSMPRRVIALHIDFCVRDANISSRSVSSLRPVTQEAPVYNGNNDAVGDADEKQKIGISEDGANNSSEAVNSPASPSNSTFEGPPDNSDPKSHYTPAPLSSPPSTPCSGNARNSASEAEPELLTTRAVSAAAVPTITPSVEMKVPIGLAHSSGPASVATGSDVFAAMMKQSKRIYRQSQCCFYLNSKGDVDLSFDKNWTPSPIGWASSVNVKEHVAAAPLSSSLAPSLQIQLTSAIPTGMNNSAHRWVRHHSRLSVPVLKSMLQKAVRRRKPLPAVRLAMELLDKAPGELLRRLPIIVLEDSMLHSDLPVLVWLMVAVSKDFYIPPALCRRVLQIVYEIAACPWLDDFSSLPADNTQQRVSFDDVIAVQSIPSSMQACIWAMMVRASYGGMPGDVRMLERYAALWLHRCRSNVNAVHGAGPETLSQPSTADGESSPTTVRWSAVPGEIHRGPRQQGLPRVEELVRAGIENLTMRDVCVEGVDFHCSQAIEYLLQDDGLVNFCSDLVILSKVSDADALDADYIKKAPRSHLEKIFESCLWRFSSGVNLRRNILTREPAQQSVAQDHAEMWKDLIAPRVREFQEQYVKQRLALSP